LAQIDLSLKMLGGVDIMSMPALQEWLTVLISEHTARAMTFPSSINLSFNSADITDQSRECKWPRGIVSVDVKEVHMPRSQTHACMPSMVLLPAVWVDQSYVRDVHAMTYPLVMDPQNPATMEHWQAAFPVFDAAQVRALLTDVPALVCK
jgi:hypothetical protein